jgi:hypothetical protein
LTYLGSQLAQIVEAVDARPRGLASGFQYQILSGPSISCCGALSLNDQRINNLRQQSMMTPWSLQLSHHWIHELLPGGYTQCKQR